MWNTTPIPEDSSMEYIDYYYNSSEFFEVEDGEDVWGMPKYEHYELDLHNLTDEQYLARVRIIYDRLIMHIFMSSIISAFNDPLLCRQGTNLLEKGGQNRRHYFFL